MNVIIYQCHRCKTIYSHNGWCTNENCPDINQLTKIELEVIQ